MELSPHPRIIKLSESNLKELVTMVLELWPQCQHDEELDFYSRLLNDTSSQILITSSDDQYTGFIHLSTRNDWVEGTTTSPVAYIEGIYIRSQYRKKGVAKALVEAGEQWALSKGFTEIGSDTELDNEVSQEFHRSVGFREANRIVCFAKKLQQ